jgi:tryptophanyl-tRNA synthetase
MTTFLSGIQPSGAPHLGNYFGAIRQHIELQSEPGECFYFIADYHALTSSRDPVKLRESVRDVAVTYLALGLDPQRAVLFRQSDVKEITELAWLLACVTGMGLLERAHSYKDKIAHGIKPSVGLFTYPILMAADILAYDTDQVPVGRDQVQHVEMAQDMAGSFNAAFGKQVLLRPEWRFSKAPAVPGTDGTKMSKSYGNTIPIFPPRGMTEKQIFKAYFGGIKTDSKGVDDPKDPNDTLMLLYRLLDPQKAAEFEPIYVKGGVGYGDIKKRLSEAYIARFMPLAERRQEIAQDHAYVEGVLEEGAKRARAVAVEVMAEAREAAGLVVASQTHRTAAPSVR